MVFDERWNESEYLRSLTGTKTLNREEARIVYQYMNIKKPATIIEIGTGKGASSRVFLTLADWLGLNTSVYTWDIHFCENNIEHPRFHMNMGNIKGYEDEILDKLRPSVVFLDCHDLDVCFNMMSLCLVRGIDLMLHDVDAALLDIFHKRSSGFMYPRVSYTYSAAVEYYLLVKFFGMDLWVDVKGKGLKVFERYGYRISLIQDGCGLAIIERE